MTRKSTQIFTAILLLLLPLQADEPAPETAAKLKSPTWFLDTWSARDSSNLPGYTMMFVEVTPTDLIFIARKDGFVARYHVEIVVIDGEDQAVGTRVFTDSVRVNSPEEISSYQWNRLFRVIFPLEDGEYTAMLHFVDDNSSTESMDLFNFSVARQPDETLDVSDILLARKDDVLADSPEASSSSILPYPLKIYGIDQEEIYCYFEIYPTELEMRDSVDFTLSFIDPDNHQEVVKTGRMLPGAGKQPILHPLNSSDLAPGYYKMLLQVKDNARRVELERTNSFYVYQSPTDLRFREYSAVLEELEMIASEAECAEMRQADADSRQSALNAFWERRNPTPGSNLNELMDEFYSRVEYSRRHYAPHRSDQQSFSDRGKIHIRYGKPDRITQAVDQINGTMLETWFYDIDLNMHVVFQDDYGFGTYRLVAPYSLLEEL